MIYATAILGVLLAISAAGNAWQFQHGEGLLEAKAAATQLNKDTTAAAAACTAGVDRIEKAGTTRQERLEAALRSIAPRVAKLNAEAIVASRAKPDDPRDLCGSLERYLRAQIKAGRPAP